MAVKGFVYDISLEKKHHTTTEYSQVRLLWIIEIEVEKIQFGLELSEGLMIKFPDICREVHEKILYILGGIRGARHISIK